MERQTCIFAVFFSGRSALQHSSSQSLLVRVWVYEALTILEKDSVRRYVGHWDVHRFMKPGKMDLGVLRELADVIVRMFSLFSWRLCWSEEIPRVRQTSHLSSRNTEKSIGKTSGPSTSLQFLERSWRNPSWKLFPATWKKRRREGTASMDLHGFKSLLSWLPSIRWLPLVSEWSESRGCCVLMLAMPLSWCPAETLQVLVIPMQFCDNLYNVKY